MENAKLFYSTKPREFVANAYASQIKSDVWEKIMEGFECKTIAEFYKECSSDEISEVTEWTYGVFGKTLCDLVDNAIDSALVEEDTDMSNVNWIVIHEAHSTPGTFWATLILDDPDHKRKKLLLEMRRNSIYY
jgi:hypothetical protein